MSADRPKVRVVFDCMVFLQGAATRLPGLSRLSEVRDVLKRPRVRLKFPALTDELVEWFLVALSKRALTIPEVPRVFRYERDPKDETYINLAIAAGASYPISPDADVLDLASPGDPDGARLRRMLRDCRF